MKNSLNLNDDKMDSFAKATVKYNVEKQLRSKYDKILAEKKEKASRKGKVIKMSSFLKVAVVVIAVLGSVFLIQETLYDSSSQSIAQNFLDQTVIHGNPDITRKGVSTATQLQREANDAYTHQDFALAIAKYEEHKTHNEISSLDQFYLGISHLKTKNYSEAIEQFEKLKVTENIRIEEVDWLLGLALVLSDQEKKAISILEEIVAEKKYKAKEASKLLDKMK